MPFLPFDVIRALKPVFQSILLLPAFLFTCCSCQIFHSIAWEQRLFISNVVNWLQLGFIIYNLRICLNKPKYFLHLVKIQPNKHNKGSTMSLLNICDSAVYTYEWQSSSLNYAAGGSRVVLVETRQTQPWKTICQVLFFTHWPGVWALLNKLGVYSAVINTHC